ncbi:MAG: hypothetical protein H6706_19845 [Myxococcales bacterium]|nr:hypothetical protein [Myxococcales bacterium]
MWGQLRRRRCGTPGASTFTYEGGGPACDLAGYYDEASDCEPGEGGSMFGGGYAQCFRKADGSAWRLWNTGCEAEVGGAESRRRCDDVGVLRPYLRGRDAAEQLSPAILGTVVPLLDAVGSAIVTPDQRKILPDG